MPFNNIPGTSMGNMGGVLENFSDHWEEMQRANQLKRSQEFQNRLSEANASQARSGFPEMFESQQPGLLNMQRGNYAPMGGGFGGLIPPSPQPQMPQRMGGSPDFQDLLNQLNIYGDNMG